MLFMTVSVPVMQMGALCVLQALSTGVKLEHIGSLTFICC